MENKDKEFISLYLPKDLIKQLEGFKDNYKLQSDVIKTFYESEKNNLKQELSQLDDELLKYKAYLLKSRELYKEASDLHYQKLEEFWNEVYKGLPEFKNKVKNISDSLIPLTEELSKVKKAIEGISTYEIKNLIEIVTLVDNLSPEKIKMFNYLIDNFKKEK